MRTDHGSGEPLQPAACGTGSKAHTLAILAKAQSS